MKFFLILCIMVIFSIPVMAECDVLSRCPIRTVGTVSRIGDFFSDKTGTTYLAEQFAKRMIENQLKETTNQDFTVEVKAFTLPELLNGDFESFTLKGNNIDLQGVRITSLEVKTLCNFNSIDIKSRPIKLRENVVLGIWIEISADDLIYTLDKYGCLNQMPRLDFPQIGLSAYKIYPSSIVISDSKLYFTVNASRTTAYKPFDILVEADIKIQNGKVLSSKLNLINLYLGYDISQIADFLNPAKYLNFQAKLFDKNVDVQIQNVKIIDNKAYLDGVIFIPKD